MNEEIELKRLELEILKEQNRLKELELAKEDSGVAILLMLQKATETTTKALTNLLENGINATIYTGSEESEKYCELTK